MRENCIEWIEGDKQATVTTYRKSLIRKLKAISEESPEAAQIIKENEDGSICAHISLSCLKIHARRKISEEKRQELAERIAKAREGKCRKTQS